MGEDADEYQSLTPLKISNLNSSVNNKVYQICCGGMHTLILTTLGNIYSWGCSDDGCLGREGNEKIPLLVEGIGIPVNGIAAGDVHSIAYSTELNELYYWGTYRVMNFFLCNIF
jgi:regulator of chromosome condensation